MTEWVNFKQIKSEVTMDMALGHYGITLRQVNASALRGNCPLPSHTDDATTNSFSVSTEKNAWACQSSSCIGKRGGEKGGNVLDFVAVMEGCSIRDAALKLQNWFNVVASNERPKDYVPSRERQPKQPELATEKNNQQDAEASEAGMNDTNREEGNKPLDFTLKSVDASHEYLQKRGIHQDVAELFGVGYFFGKGSMSNRVVIPIHNRAGELVAYAGRVVDDSEPKYNLPAGFHKSLELFNLHRATQIDASGGVVIVEGYFDALKVFQAGFPCVVALMGSALSEQQEQLLMEHFETAIVMLDGDDGGRAAATEIAARLVRKLFVRVVDVPDGTQPDRLSSDEIQKLLAFL